MRTVGWLASIFQKLLLGIEVESTTSPMPAQAGWLAWTGGVEACLLDLVEPIACAGQP